MATRKVKKKVLSGAICTGMAICYFGVTYRRRRKKNLAEEVASRLKTQCPYNELASGNTKGKSS